MTTTYNVLHLPEMVDIGYQTESGVRQIGFDVKPWFEAYGDLTLSIWLTRPGEDVAYPAADVERVGTVLYWTPNGADTAIEGVGRVEVLGLTVEKRKLSGWCKTLVRATSLSKTQDPPEAAAPWVDSVLGAANRITGMQVATETLEAGSDATSDWNGDAGLLTLGIPSGAPGPKGDMGPAGHAGPKGEPFTYSDFTAEQLAALKGDPGPAGADGVSPTVTTSKSGKVTTITIKDAAGTKTATINDGADGAKGDPGEPGAPGKDAVVDATLTQEGQAADAKATGEAVSQLKDDVATLHDQADALFALCLDGTPATYKAVMKSFFLTNGASTATPAELTALCDRWYTATRTGWDGGVKFYQPDVSAVSDGEKIGNNAGLTCTPSTNTVAGQDDYAGLPLFACVDVNWIVDPNTLEPVITAIDGITDSFDRYDPAKFVGVMQMSGYRWWNDVDTNYYLRGYCDSLKPYANIEPLAEAVRASDNSVRPWVVHAKYMAKVESGKFTCYSGVIPTAYSVSHNSSHTYAKAVGPQYSGGTAADNAWLKLMSMIKYGIMTQDGVNQGCVHYNFQYPVAVAESGVQRVIITKDQAANLIVGSSVIIGNYAGNLDRNNPGMYSITGQAGAVITSIQDVTIDGNTYAAVNVDCDAFDTVANGASTTGTTYISTWHWRSGTCDNVLGNDGSPDSPGSGKYPAMIQGIEYSVGGYEVYADVILNLYKDSNDVYWYEPYLVNRSAQQSTGITSNYKATGLKCQQPDASNWLYIKKEGYAKGIYFPVLVGGSSSTYHRDGFYMQAASTGTREWLAFGVLYLGVGNGGLSSLYGRSGLSPAGWNILARLSPNGNRGEWAA